MKQPNLTAYIFDKRGRVLSIGKNSYVKTHPLQGKHAQKVGNPERIYLHAEIAAIAKCRSLNKAHRILITRFGAGGEPRLARPCEICMSAIKATKKIKVIDYTVG